MIEPVFKLEIVSFIFFNEDFELIRIFGCYNERIAQYFAHVGFDFLCHPLHNFGFGEGRVQFWLGVRSNDGPKFSSIRNSKFASDPRSP